MKRTYDTNQVTMVSLDDLVDVYNSWKAASGEIIIPASIKNFQQVTGGFLNIIERTITELSGKDIDKAKELPFATISQLMQNPVNPNTLAMAVGSLDNWMKLPDAETGIALPVEEIIKLMLQGRLTVGILRNALFRWYQIKSTLINGFMPSSLTIEGKPVEHYETLLTNAMARLGSDPRTQVLFSKEEGGGFQVILNLVKRYENDLRFNPGSLLGNNNNLNLAKQLRILRKRLEYKEGHMNTAFTLLEVTMQNARLVEADVEAKNQAVEKLDQDKATDPTVAVTLPRAKLELEQRVNDLLILNTQIKNFRKEIEDIQKEIGLIQTRINEITVAMRKNR
jgi:hypothetical protein